MTEISCNIVTPSVEKLAKELKMNADLVNSYISSWQSSYNKPTMIPEVHELKRFIEQDLEKEQQEELDSKILEDYQNQQNQEIINTGNIEESQPKEAPYIMSLDEYKNHLNIKADKYSEFIKAFNPQVLADREALIASLFKDRVSEYVEEYQEMYSTELKENPEAIEDIISWKEKLQTLEDPVKGRQFILSEVGIDTIIKDVKEFISDCIDGVSEYETGEYSKIDKHFDFILEGALRIIEANENVKITLEEDVFEDNDDGKEVSGNAGWSFRIKFLDPITSMTAKVKDLLSSIPLVDKEGNNLRDDLGYIKYMDGNLAYITLLNELSFVTRPTQFVSGKGKDIKFPALENIKDKHLWVQPLINTLTNIVSIDGDSVVSQFYNAIRKDFVSQKILTYSKENIIFDSLNAPPLVETLIEAVQRNITNGYQLSELSIYDKLGNVFADNIDKLQDKINEVKDTIGTDEYIYDDDVVKEAEDIFKAIGFDPHHLNIKRIKSEEVLNALSSANYLLNDVKENKDIKDYNIYNSNTSRYNLISAFIGIVDDLFNSISFRQGKETYQSFQAPCYANTLIKELKNDEFRDEILNKYKQCNFFYRGFNKTWRNKWLELIENNEEVRNNIATDELQFIKLGSKEAKSYKEWSPEEINIAFVGKYFSTGYTNEKDIDRIQYGYYNFPIFSDSETAKFIKFVKYSNIEDVVDNLVELARQELSRIKVVQQRKEKIKSGEISELSGYDKYGAKFCFLPFLNEAVIQEGEYKGKNIVEAIRQVKKTNPTQAYDITNTLLRELISNQMRTESTNFIYNFPKEDGRLATLLESYGFPLPKKKEERNAVIDALLKNYYYNHKFAESQIYQLYISDLALYGSTDKLQKRLKELLFSGNKPNTESTYGKRIERNIYLKDFITSSTVYTEIKDVINDLVKQREISQIEANRILDTFQNINSTDGQAFRTFKSYRSLCDMFGEWSQSQEEAYNRYENGEATVEDLNVVNQTQKPATYGTVVEDDGVGGKILVGHQHKNSEFILLEKYPKISAALKNNPILKGLQEFMEEADLDTAQFESAVKTGASYLIDLRYDPKQFAKVKNNTEYLDNLIDKYKKVSSQPVYLNSSNITYDDFINVLKVLLDKGIMRQDTYNKTAAKLSFSNSKDVVDYLKEVTAKTGYIHEISYNDYMRAQPTPEHLFDVEQSTLGSQFVNLIPADMPDDMIVNINNEEYTKDEVYDLWETVRSQRMLDGYKESIDVFKSIESLRERLLNMIKGNPKYGRDLYNALDIVVDPYGNKTFRTPLFHPSIRPLTEELLTSIFKNSVTKQKMKGGAAILASATGSDDLHIIFNKDKGIEAVEAYLPAYSRQFIEPLLVEKEDIDGSIYYELDIENLDEGLKTLIGYRIPTEDKYSIWKLRIKGFLPQQNGSAVMMPSDLINCAGWDFDVDKLFLLIPAFENKEGTFKKIQYEKQGKITPKDIEQMSSKERDNFLIDIAASILSHPNTAQKALNPGNFESYKAVGRKLNILKDWSLWNKWTGIYGKDSIQTLINAGFSTVENFVKQNRKDLDPLSLDTFIFYHTQNMAGLDLISINAVNSIMHAKSQHTDLTLKFPNNNSIIINGIEIGNLHEQYNSKGERISKNTASGISAAVDNAKDQALADLNLNPKTAGFGGGLLRFGLSPLTLGLMYNLPTVNYYIKKGRTLRSIFTQLIEDYKLDPNTIIAAYGNNKITDASLIQLIIDYKDVVLLNNELKGKTEEEASAILAKPENARIKDLQKKEIEISFLLCYLAESYSSIEAVTRISKTDSKNNALAITIAEAENQVSEVRGVQNYYAYDKDYITINSHNVSGIEAFNRNISVADPYSMKAVSSALKQENKVNKKLKALQASYSLGIQFPLSVISKYYLNDTPAVKKGVDKLRFDTGKSTIPKKMFNDYYYGIITYALAKETDMFGKDYIQKRKYYIEEYPEVFISVMQNSKNKDIKALGALSKLTVKGGKIIMDKSGRLRPELKEALSRDMLTLLYLDNPAAQKLAYDLVMYSYFTDGLRFGPNNYNALFNTRFLESFPELTQTLYKLPYLLQDDSYLDSYNRLFYIQKGTEFLSLVPGTADIQYSTAKVNVDTEGLYNPYMKSYEGTNIEMLQSTQLRTRINKEEKIFLLENPMIVGEDVQYNNIIEIKNATYPIYWPGASLEDINTPIKLKNVRSGYTSPESAFESDFADISPEDYGFSDDFSDISPEDAIAYLDLENYAFTEQGMENLINDFTAFSPETVGIESLSQEYLFEESDIVAKELCEPVELVSTKK